MSKKVKEKVRKNIDISEQAVEILAIQAIKNKTVFKPYVESILEDFANDINKKINFSWRY